MTQLLFNTSTPILREKLAGIIATTCRCEPGPLLDDQGFAAVITQFDSLAILEILLEIETEFGLTTDEMLPTQHDVGAQEFTAIFPKNLSELIAYMHVVAERRLAPESQADAQPGPSIQGKATSPAGQPDSLSNDEPGPLP